MFRLACAASWPGTKSAPSSKWAGRRSLKNGELLNAAEMAVFDVVVTADQNIKYQQDLAGRKLALVVLGSNIWLIVREHAATIAAKVDAATPGSYDMTSSKCRSRRGPGGAGGCGRRFQSVPQNAIGAVTA